MKNQLKSSKCVQGYGYDYRLWKRNKGTDILVSHSRFVSEKHVLRKIKYIYNLIIKYKYIMFMAYSGKI